MGRVPLPAGKLSWKSHECEYSTAGPELTDAVSTRSTTTTRTETLSLK